MPDAKTVWLYREELAQAGKMAEVIGLFDGYLARQGYIVRGGQILDASIVPVAHNHNKRAENAAIKAGEVPECWADKPAKRSQKDVDVEDGDGALVGAQVGPDVFARVQLWCTGRQVQERDFVRDYQCPGTVPSGPVEDEEDQKMIGVRAKAFDPGATVRAISARWAVIAAVLAKGSTRPAATARPGQTAPKM